MTHEQAYELLPDLVGLRVAHPAEAEIHAHVTSCATCAARRRDLERVAHALEIARDAHAISLTGLEERVLAIPKQQPRRPVGRFRRRIIPAGVGVAAAASIAALTLALTGPDVTQPPSRFDAQQTVALHPIRGSVSGTVELGRPSGATRVVRLKIRGLPLTGARSFDLWFISASGAMRAGSFGPGEDGSCVVDLTTAREEDWQSIAITPTGSGPHKQVIAAS